MVLEDSFQEQVLKKKVRTINSKASFASPSGAQTSPGFIFDGNVVRNVFAGGPADRAGLKKGDVIQAINNLPTAADSCLLAKHLAAVPDGSAVFLTWTNQHEQITKASVELVDAERFQDIAHAYLKMLQLEGAAAALVESVDAVLHAEAAGAESSEEAKRAVIEKLVAARTRVRDGTASLETDIAAMLSRQRAAEEEVRRRRVGCASVARRLRVGCAVAGGGERSQVEGSGRRWRGAVSGEGERSQVEGSGLR